MVSPGDILVQAKAEADRVFFAKEGMTASERKARRPGAHPRWQITGYAPSGSKP